MSQQPTTNPTRPPTAVAQPWSPLVVGFITLFLPAGGVVLAIRDMQRLGMVEERAAKQLVWTAVAILTLGYAMLTFTAPRQANGVPRLDDNAAAFLSAALGVGAYFALRKPFLLWRTRAARGSARLLPAVATALLYQAIVIVAVVVVVLVVGPMVGMNTLEIQP